jgi:cytoskeleton protein RodZ
MESEARHEHAVGIGTWLRAGRLKKGEELVAVARILRIRVIYLKAIEDGRFGDLPGPTYAVGFVRAYAEHLGLDGDEVVRRYKEEVSGINGAAELHFPSPRSEGGTPKWAVLIGGAIFAILSYGVWYVNSTRDDVVVEFVTSVPDRLGQLLSPDAGTGEEPKTEEGSVGSDEPGQAAPSLAVAATGATDQQDDAPRTGDAQRQVAPTSEGMGRSPSEKRDGEVTSSRTSAPDTEATQVATAQPIAEAPREPASSTDNGRTSAALPEQTAVQPTEPMVDRVVAAVEPGSEPGLSPESGGPSGTSFGDPEEARIVLRAKAESWIQVRDEPNDRVLLARLLRPGDVYRVPNRSGLNLWTGNAGGLEILVDGEPVPSIGETGVVRRRVALEVEPLLSGAAVR